MIALGGVIGAGLFVGSGAGIAAAGPSIVIAYAASGALVMLVMRMLGEMSAAHPASGSFSVHAQRALGPWAGFTSGWIYWTLLCVAIATEATAAADIMTGWLPGTESWMWVALFMALFCGTNLVAVRNFGEAEFWFAALKIFAITAFLLLGVFTVIGVVPGVEAPGASNLTGEGGFFPNGANGLVVGLLASVFAYGGLETVTIAAAESENPVRGVAKAVRTAVWRIAIFYVGSMLVIVTLIPWDDKSVLAGPYAAVLDYVGIPAAAQLMNIVVLVALLSAMNANIYGASRMSFSLIDRGEGPAFLGKVSRGGVPRRAVIASSVIGFVAVLFNYWWPDTVFLWLLNMVGAATLVVWGFIAVSQLITRRRLEREAPEKLVVKMWGFPWLTCVAIVGIVAVLGLMLREGDTRTQLAFTAGLTVVLAVVGLLRQKLRARSAEGAAPAGEAAVPATGVALAKEDAPAEDGGSGAGDSDNSAGGSGN
ncbi:amino acid permease [Streptomyces sp. HNM0574]|nr:amino acid permease [Streptomyces sp. HNM0574]